MGGHYMGRLIYLTSNVRIENNTRVHKQLRLVHEMFPNSMIVYRDTTSGSDDYINACKLMIIFSEDELVNRKVYNDVKYAKEKQKKMYLIKQGSLLEIKSASIKHECDWIRHAKLLTNI